jgi:flap endonuclease-1
LAFGVASEDMDSLTFGAKHLLRGFNSKKEPIVQIDLQAMLEGFEMSMDEFIDLCIMCGCDYTHSIGGIGPIKALKLVKDEKNIENILLIKIIKYMVEAIGSFKNLAELNSPALLRRRSDS